MIPVCIYYVLHEISCDHRCFNQCSAVGEICACRLNNNSFIFNFTEFCFVLKTTYSLVLNTLLVHCMYVLDVTFLILMAGSLHLIIQNNMSNRILSICHCHSCEAARSRKWAQRLETQRKTAEQEAN